MTDCERVARFLRVGALTAALALTPLALTGGGAVSQNDLCGARTDDGKCCRELNSVCMRNGSTMWDAFYLDSGFCPKR